MLRQETDSHRVHATQLIKSGTAMTKLDARRDPRLIPGGAALRAMGLDELPQLINVLLGEMALVGPRPITVPELRRYGAARWKYLSVLPGMTGLWQVSGRNWTSYERRVELDQLYVKNRSAWLDCKILAKTFKVVITHHGAC